MNYVSYSSINQYSLYMLLSKQLKSFGFYVKFHLVKIFNLLIKKIIYLLKIILVYTLKAIHKSRFITKYIPYQVKTKIKARLLLYPRLTLFLKKLNNMINLRNNKLKVSVISYIFSVLIKILFIPLFNILLKTNLFKKLFFEKLTINSDLYINFKKIDRNYVQKPEKFSVKNIQYQLELSSETLEIYKDFQLVVNNLL